MIRESSDRKYSLVCDICELFTFLEYNNNYTLKDFEDSVVVCRKCVIDRGRDSLIRDEFE